MLRLERIVNSKFNSNTWMLSATGSNQVWLVDCGDVAPILQKLDGKSIAGILLTHAHFDHIYGLNEIIRLFPESKIFTNISGRETLGNSKHNMSFYQEKPMTVVGGSIAICGEGDNIELFSDVKAEVYETPGHHPSCLTFVVGDYIFTGDAYIPGVKVVTNLPKGNKAQALESLDRIFKLAEGKTIFPGHQCRKTA